MEAADCSMVLEDMVLEGMASAGMVLDMLALAGMVLGMLALEDMVLGTQALGMVLELGMVLALLLGRELGMAQALVLGMAQGTVLAPVFDKVGNQLQILQNQPIDHLHILRLPIDRLQESALIF